jgi:hypothetical protein
MTQLPPSGCEKIDIEQEYPCPCRRRGCLRPITLTEAFGCDRCSAIFALQEDGRSLLQLGGLDPCGRVWYWLRGKWQSAQRSQYDRFVWYYRILPVLTITLLFLVLLVALPWLLAA